MRLPFLPVLLVLALAGSSARAAEKPILIGMDLGFSRVDSDRVRGETIFAIPSSLSGYRVPQIRIATQQEPWLVLEAALGYSTAGSGSRLDLGLSGMFLLEGDWEKASPYLRLGFVYFDPKFGPRAGVGVRFPLEERFGLRSEFGLAWADPGGEDYRSWSLTLGFTFRFPGSAERGGRAGRRGFLRNPRQIHAREISGTGWSRLIPSSRFRRRSP